MQSWKRSEKMQKAMDRFLLKIPVFGDLLFGGLVGAGAHGQDHRAGRAQLAPPHGGVRGKRGQAYGETHVDPRRHARPVRHQASDGAKQHDQPRAVAVLGEVPPERRRRVA